MKKKESISKIKKGIDDSILKISEDFIKETSKINSTIGDKIERLKYFLSNHHN